MWGMLHGYAGGSPDGVKAGVHALLLLTEVAIGGYFVLAKIALSAGVHQLVFAVYRNAFGLSILIPFAYFYETKSRKPVTLPVLRKYILLAFIGVYLNQFLFYTGLVLTTATFASAMQNLVPVVTLVVAAIYKLEVIGFKHRCGRAKISGLAMCVLGAILMTVYKGPPLLRLKSTPPVHLSASFRMFVERLSGALGFIIQPWRLGALCLLANCCCKGIFINIQSVALAKHPAPVSLAASVFSIGELMLIATGLALVRDPSDWVFTAPSEIAAILYAGAIVSCLGVGAIAWAISHTGPVLAASYAPLQAVATAILAFVFLKETFHLGSFIGSVLIIVGLYLVNWGQRASKGAMEAITSLDSQVVNAPRIDIKEPLLG